MESMHSLHRMTGRCRPAVGSIVALLALAAWLACGKDSPTTPTPVTPVATRIDVTPSSPQPLNSIGQTVQLASRVLDQNGQPVAGAVVAWSSGDAAVATVNASGLVTAVSNGTTQITVRSGSVSASATVTVMQSAGSIAIEPQTATLMSIGETVQLASRVLDQNGQPVAGAVVAWSSGDAAVATVNASGLVTAVSNGTTQITVRSGSVSASATVTVMQSAGSIAIEPQTATLMSIGETVQLASRVLDQNGQPVAGAVVAWSSGDAAVATVNASGLVTAVSNGTTQITVRSGSVSASATVTVMQSAGSIAIEPQTATLMSIGETVQLASRVLDQNGQPVAGAVVAWSSGDAAVATVNASGLVTAVSNGTTQITVRSGSVSASATVTVMQSAGSIAIEPQTATLMSIGETVQLASRVLDQNGQPVAGAVVAWSSGDAAVAAVNASGLVTAVSNGTTQITVRSGSVSASATVTVMQSAGSIAIEPQTATLMSIGETVQLASRVLDQNGQPVAGAVVAWSSGDESVATVDENGLVTAVESGTTFITARAENLSSQVIIQVSASSTRAVLLALFESTDGPNWKRNDGWNTDAPLREWYGVRTRGETELVTSIDLQDNHLRGTIPPELGNLSELEYLALTRNRLAGGIPLELGNLRRLEYLALGNNYLSGGIPLELGNLRRLEYLALGNNYLSGGIPPELGNLSELGYLGLSGNELVGGIPPELGDLVNLRSLWLSSLPGVGGRLPRTFLNLGKLVNFHFYLTGLCAPSDPLFQSWLQGVENLEGNTCNAGEFDHRSILQKIYAETTGPDWHDGTNWGSDRPLDEWYGVEADSADLVIGLYLSDNGLSGRLPESLGNLTTLKRLQLRDNLGLEGVVPKSLTSISVLTLLDIEGTMLCLPPSARFNDWLSRSHLDVRGSRCDDDYGNTLEDATLISINGTTSGTLNYEEDEDWFKVDVNMPGLLKFRRMNDDREMTLALYSEDVVKLADDVEFRNGLSQKVVPGTYFIRVFKISRGRTTYNLSLTLEPNAPGARAYLTQAVQTPDGAVPLIAGKDALLRVFVIDSNDEQDAMPPVQATFYQDGMLVHEANIPSSDVPIPTEMREDDLSVTANSLIPGNVIAPGLEMVVNIIDTDSTLDLDQRVVRRIPESGRLAVDVREVPDFVLTVVPIILAESPDLDLISAVAELESGHTAFYETRNWLPVSEFEVVVRDPLIVSEIGSGLEIIEMFRISDGGTGHYLGFTQSRVGGAARGKSVIVGGDMLTESYASLGRTIAHELGHTFSLSHTPCGGVSGVDPHYPHNFALIGAWGYDIRDQNLVDPSFYYDMMSYCGPQWISDYSFIKATDFRLSSQALSVMASRATGASDKVLLLRGGRRAGQMRLSPAFAIEAPAVLPDGPGPYRLTGSDAGGRELFRIRFAMTPIADDEEEDAVSFIFAVPASSAWVRTLDRITLEGPDGFEEIGRVGGSAEILVRDANTGHIRAILSGGTTEAAVESVAGVNSVILHSRGIPDSEQWQR